MLQLKIMLHALGYFQPGQAEPTVTSKDALIYTQDAVEALDRFRAAQEWGTTVPGYVDARVIGRLWSKLEEAGKAEEIRRKLLELQRVR